jgi:hypothetical protein
LRQPSKPAPRLPNISYPAPSIRRTRRVCAGDYPYFATRNLLRQGNDLLVRPLDTGSQVERFTPPCPRTDGPQTAFDHVIDKDEIMSIAWRRKADFFTRDGCPQKGRDEPLRAFPWPVNAEGSKDYRRNTVLPSIKFDELTRQGLGQTLVRHRPEWVTFAHRAGNASVFQGTTHVDKAHTTHLQRRFQQGKRTDYPDLDCPDSVRSPSRVAFGHRQVEYDFRLHGADRVS